MTTTPALVCRQLTVEIGGRRIVDGVDLELVAGEWLALIGPNGAGKSTVLRALTGLVDHGGTVTIGQGAGRPGPAEVALVPQSPVLPIGMTVEEYVLLGRTAHLGWLARESQRDRRVVADVVERLDLTPYTGRLITTLSGGEAQRVVVARALAQQTSILLLDEPTSALDLGHQMAVLRLVDELRRSDGLTVLSALHDLTVAARFADRLALLDGGRLEATGRPTEVLEPDRLGRVYGTELVVTELEGQLVVLPAPNRVDPVA